jgi:hypothetical protein
VRPMLLVVVGLHRAADNAQTGNGSCTCSLICQMHGRSCELDMVGHQQVHALL